VSAGAKLQDLRVFVRPFAMDLYNRQHRQRTPEYN